MRIIMFLFLVFGLALPAGAKTSADLIVTAARARTQSNVHYDGKYMQLKYPGGDVSADTGVCTDVIIRTYRNALGFDLQKAVHEDMKANFAAYPKIWGLKHTDTNIDPRRVPNLETFLKRKGASLPVTQDKADYLPGDLVTWRLDGKMPHIGIVSDKKNADGIPLIIHNVGMGPQEDELLFLVPTYRHYRYIPD